MGAACPCPPPGVIANESIMLNRSSNCGPAAPPPAAVCAGGAYDCCGGA